MATEPTPPTQILAIEEPPEAPPSKRTLAGRYAEALDFVRANAGQWIALLDFADRESVAKSTTAGLNAQVADIEFTCRGSKIYARTIDTEAVKGA